MLDEYGGGNSLFEVPSCTPKVELKPHQLSVGSTWDFDFVSGTASYWLIFLRTELSWWKIFTGVALKLRNRMFSDRDSRRARSEETRIIKKSHGANAEAIPCCAVYPISDMAG